VTGSLQPRAWCHPRARSTHAEQTHPACGTTAAEQDRHADVVDVVTAMQLLRELHSM
jgi:hypothetical protein